MQFKSGSSYLSEADADGYVFRIDQEHVEYWINHALPVLICLCDVDAGILYWQAVNSGTAISTGKGFKFSIPASQKVDADSVGMFRSLLTPVIAAEKYTIFKTNDMSHAGAKRYSLEAVINSIATKAEVAAMVRQLTSNGARRYHRNDLVDGLWGNSDAHVVWTFIYPSAEDHTRCNHICRSIWIHNDLEEQFRPMGFDGENVGDNIIVDWSPHYNFLAEYVSHNTLSKEEYLSTVLPLVEELEEIMQVLQAQSLALSQGEVTESELISRSKSSWNRINTIYFKIRGMSFAPFECSDMDTKLESFVAYLDSTTLFYSDKGLKTWDRASRLEQSLQQQSYAREAFQQLDSEISKVR
jgi:hypothetical protein